MKAKHAAYVVLCLALLGSSGFNLVAQDYQPVYERPQRGGIEAIGSFSEGDVTVATTPVGTAPELSVFSVLRFSGSLMDSDGTPRSGVVGMTFALYPDQMGGSPLWLETQNVAVDANGRYTVLLGSQSSEGLPAEVFSAGEARWLSIQAGTEPELPRIMFVSVPYAMKAREADRLGGRTAEEFVLDEELEAQVRTEVRTQIELEATDKSLSTAGSGTVLAATIDGDGTAGTIPKFTGPAAIADSIISDDGLGLVSVGGRAEVRTGTAPQTSPLLFVGGQFNEDGVPPVDGMLTVNNTSGDGFGLRVNTGGTAIWAVSTITTGFKAALFGSTQAENGRGILAKAVATTGAARGVEAETAADGGMGILAMATSPTGATRGIRADVSSPQGVGILLEGQGGRHIIARSAGVETFSVQGDGTVLVTRLLFKIGTDCYEIGFDPLGRRLTTDGPIACP